MDEKEFSMEEYKKERDEHIKKMRILRQQIQKEREEFYKKLDSMTEEEGKKFLRERYESLENSRDIKFKSVETLTKKDDEEN